MEPRRAAERNVHHQYRLERLTLGGTAIASKTGPAMPATKKTFTPEEADSILEQLEAGEKTHVIAARHECSPADIFWLWDERNRAR